MYVYIGINFCVLSPCLFNSYAEFSSVQSLSRVRLFATPWTEACQDSLYAEYIMRNARLDEAQAGIKTAGEISITSGMQMTPTLWKSMKKN